MGTITKFFTVVAVLSLASMTVASAQAAKNDDSSLACPGKNCDPLQTSPHRGGGSRSIAPWAVRTHNRRYAGYYVGGGTVRPRVAARRKPSEGTWGWDFVGGPLYRRRVQLGWLHGRDRQQPHGAYKTDGPHPLKHE